MYFITGPNANVLLKRTMFRQKCGAPGPTRNKSGG